MAVRVEKVGEIVIVAPEGNFFTAPLPSHHRRACVSGAGGRTRTCDLRIMRPSL